MTIVNVILTLNDQEIVPVRAIPFVTGGDMGPRCLACILFDPEQDFWAFALGADNAVTPIAPKNWRQYKAQLSTAGSDSPDLYVESTLKILPASTFVYWESLWRNYDANFRHDRMEIHKLPPIEQENYVLKKSPDIPEALVKLVTDGFQALLAVPDEKTPSEDNKKINSRKAKPDGRMKIQAEAYEYWIRLKASGGNPTVNSICEAIARWCADTGTTTHTGTTPTAGTIRNSILSGSSKWEPPTHSRDQAKEHVARLERLAQVAQIESGV